MKRYVFGFCWALLLIVYCFAEAAQSKSHRIGYLTSGSVATTSNRKIFTNSLHRLGYVEGQNLIVEYRYAEGRNERLPALAADLVRIKVEAIVAVGTQAILAAKNATATIPIVMASSSDPLGKGLAKTLSRPGENVTGVSSMNVELTGKRLELFRDAFSKARRLGVFWYGRGNITFEQIQKTAEPRGFSSISLEVNQPEDFETAFAVAKREQFDSLFTANAAFIGAHRKRIIDFAAKNKVPAIYHQELFVEDGGLMSYSGSSKEFHRQAAIYVAKVLKGAKPADLPVLQPTKFELWINLKTAKQIGVTIPQQVLYRADTVIR